MASFWAIAGGDVSLQQRGIQFRAFGIAASCSKVSDDSKLCFQGKRLQRIRVTLVGPILRSTTTATWQWCRHLYSTFPVFWPRQRCANLTKTPRKQVKERARLKKCDCSKTCREGLENWFSCLPVTCQMSKRSEKLLAIACAPTQRFDSLPHYNPTNGKVAVSIRNAGAVGLRRVQHGSDSADRILIENGSSATRTFGSRQPAYI